MERIADKLSKYVFTNQMIGLEDIEDIAIILDSYFRDKIYQGMDILNNSIYPMSYSFINNKIGLEYKYLKDEVLRNYQNYHGVQKLDYITYFNISIILLLFHEFRHSMQAYEIKCQSPLGLLYQKSIDYITKSSNYCYLFHLAMYRIYHDYFPVEINANYWAFLCLWELFEIWDLDNTSFWENLFLDRVSNQYNFKEYDYFHREVLNDARIIEELSNTLDEREKILNGIYLPNPKSIDIRELLLK